MAVGAIPPPLFFERRHRVSMYCGRGILDRAIRKQSASIRQTVGFVSPTRDRSLPKDF
jgi:hypothetical protein